MKYKNLFFDLDDTIWAFSQNARDTFEEVYQKYSYERYFDSFDHFYAIYQKRNTELWVEYGEGKITKDELNRQRFFYPLMSVGVEDEALAEQFSKDFFSIIPTKRGLMPYAKEVLEYLAPKYNLYILSNVVNVRGDNIGNIISDNHYTMAKAKLNKDNGDTFYYVFDEASAVKLRDSESYGFNGYVAMFEKGEAVHYDSVEKASEELNLPNLADAIEANNAAALAGEPDEFGRRNCPYIETRDGLWAIRVDPTFYLTTAGLAIDTDCHVLNEEKKAIPGLYAAGDVCGSIEEKDAKQYGMGFDAALTYGYIMGETLKKEI